MKKVVRLSLVLSIAVTNMLAQALSSTAQHVDKRSFDPDAAQIVTSDIALFWRAYDMAKPENDLIVFRDQYLRKGSIGLKEFTRTRIGSSCELVDALNQH